MKLTTQSQRAIMAMMALALHTGRKVLRLSTLARDQGISLSYMEQLFYHLRHAELVEGIRGPGGGYRLGRPASHISIAEIVEAIESANDEAEGPKANQRHEIDKMLINIGDEPLITVDHIYKNIGISKEYNVFELQKALAFKNVIKANEIIHYFKSDPKSNPIIPIIANIFAFFNKLLLVHHSKDKSDRHLAALLGVHPFFVKEYVMAIRNYPVGKVVANIRHIKVADMKSKGIDYPSQGDGEILKELIFNVLH